MSTLSAIWAERGWEVTILTSQAAFHVNDVAISERVRLEHLGFLPEGENISLVDKLKAFVCGISRVRRAAKRFRPDVMIAFLDWSNILAIIATRGLRIPVIISERSIPQLAPLSAEWRFLRPITYPLASAIVAVSNAVLRGLPATKNQFRYVIPGPIAPPIVQKRSSGKPRSRIVAAGRLVPVKGFDLLLEALRLIRHLDWQLTIWGDGPDRKTLEQLAANLEFGDRVSFPGFTLMLYDELMESDIFVLSSRFEGYPRALAEAMMCGLAVIGFDCPGAPSEMIENEVNGLLVESENIQSLSAAIARVINDEELRMRLASRAPEIAKICSTAVTIDKWDEVIQQVVPSRRPGELTQANNFGLNS